jgi:hypothetical protein
LRPALALAGVALLLAACQQDPFVRSDKIAFHAGESSAYNKAVHIIDPWPAGSRRTSLEHDGRHMVRVIEQYQGDHAAASGGGAPVAPPAPPPASPPP